MVDLNIFNVTSCRQQQTNAERVRTDTDVSAQRVDDKLQRGLLRYDIQSLDYVQQTCSYSAHTYTAAWHCCIYVYTATWRCHIYAQSVNQLTAANIHNYSPLYFQIWRKVKYGKSHHCQVAVTLCDPIWHVISRSGEVISMNCYTHLLYLFTFRTLCTSLTGTGKNSYITLTISVHPTHV